MRTTADKNIHDGHRQRVRNKFLNDMNFDNYPEHNILEMLLFYSIPRGDTNELAHALIERFGSLQNVLSAPVEALKAVPGVGEQTAILLKIVSEISRKQIKNTTANIKYIMSDSEVFEYLKPIFNDKKNELLVMICLNNTGKILKTSVISEGASDFACVDTRKIAQEIIFSHAKQIIIAHNHPGGICAPSQSDIQTTRQLSRLIQSLNAQLINHIIIADDDYFSFMSNSNTAGALLVRDAMENDLNSYAEEGEKP